MAKSTQPAGLMAKYGNRLSTSIKKHAGDETKFGPIPLPGGIKNGVAKLVECKFDVHAEGDNKGEYYFRAAGVVIEPKTVRTPDGRETPVAGLQTSIIIPVYDRKDSKGRTKTQEEFVSDIMNEMRKLGADTSSIESAAELEATAEALKEQGPYFKFSTSQGKATEQYPEPRVWENWHGVQGLDDYSPSEEAMDIDDSTDNSNDNPEGFDEEELKPKNTKKKQPDPEPEEEPEETTDQEDQEESGLLESVIKDMVRDADSPNPKVAVKAQAELTKKALAAGVSKKDIDEAESWEAVGQLILNAGASEEETEEETEESEPEEEEESFNVGDVVIYKPVDPKTMKPMVDPKTKKPKEIECEITRKNKNGTYELKNMSDRKIVYKDISEDDLNQPG